jgi:MFS transporter, DHA2 family, multidrug resistance protein
VRALPSYAPSQVPVVPRHALIGIVAVLLAAVNSSLGGGLISAGLEDLRGAWGLGVDDAAYVPTAFNAAQMFIGPLSVILAARFGHRRVLLYAGGIYILSSLFLPFMPRIVMTLFFLIVGGLASGTFFPLCLSFIGRNLPVRLIPFGIAAYTMDFLGTGHITQALEGFYLDHFSWHWLFWNQAILTLPMLLCVHYGIPPTPRKELIPECSYTGVLYVSGGLTLLYIALDQGERLDWYNNGLINGLVVVGTLLLIAALIKRKVNPYRFLDFSYLKARNILLLGLLLVAFRVNLLRAAFLIPLFLETLHQYRPPETGHLLLLSLIPYLVALPIIAYFMRRVHVRYLLLYGFWGLGIVNFYDAHALSTWTRSDFVTQQMLGSLALCMAVTGVFSGVIFEGRLTGAYRNRAGAYCQGVFIQVVRLFSQEASVSAARRFILVREHYWHTKLVADTASAWQFGDRVMHLGTALAPQAAGPLQRPEIAIGLIASSVQSQALTLAIDDSFMLLALVSLVSVIAVGLMRPIPLPHQLPDADAVRSRADLAAR